MEHPNGGTVIDIANRLEQKYDLLRTFVVLHKSDLEKIIASEMALAIKHGYDNIVMDSAIDGRIKEVWRSFLMNEEHGIRTKAAEEKNRQSFIDSGTYMNALTIGVTR